MNNIQEIIKKAGLFLFGVVLIIWGYKANATNKEGKAAESDGLSPMLKTLEEAVKQQQEAKEEPKPEPKKEEPVKTTNTPARAEKKPEVKKVEQQTVIEKETPEESSGTE